MDRRLFLQGSISSSAIWLGVLASTGCRGRQVAHVLGDEQSDMVGSHEAGAETYNRLVEEAVARLLARQEEQLAASPVSYGPEGPKRVCFVGVENKSAEEIGDFKEQLYQMIDTAISSSDAFEPISIRFVQAGLQQCHLRPEQLFTPDAQRAFITAMEQQGQTFDYLLFATLTSGTTQNNNDQQRDYLLTLDIVNMNTGAYDKESAKVRKGYHQSYLGKWRIYNPFTTQR